MSSTSSAASFHVQLTLEVEESKRLIALGVASHPLVQQTLQKGKVLLKGGTTVSHLSEVLTGKPLAICGRITSRGTVTGLYPYTNPHVLLIQGSIHQNIDQDYMEQVMALGPEDMFICGANALDAQGNAAIMAGSSGGGEIGYALSCCYMEGVPVLVPVGIEKMVPGNLPDTIKRTGRKTKSLSAGMAVGLVPVIGEIVTELEAIRLLAEVDCAAIGAGGLGSARGSVTLDVWGPQKEIHHILGVIHSLKKSSPEVSGADPTLTECRAPCPSCADHLGCWYKSGDVAEPK